MASQFDRWEKDPFFPAAEEVQESADRMESSYRTWIHVSKAAPGKWHPEELQRDLRTALGTTKWQLEEFERAVNSSYAKTAADDSKERHRNFIVAIKSQILKVETSLNKLASSQGKPPMPWIRLDEGESDELALFLSGPSASSASSKNFGRVNGRNPQVVNSHEADKLLGHKSSMNTSHSMVWNQVETEEEKLPGHRRTASAGADMCTWNIAMAEDAVSSGSSNVQADPPPRKIPSFSGFLNKMEFAAKLKWAKNGYRKLSHSQSEAALPRTQPLTRGINSCFERNKSCLEGSEDCYNKHLYGWYGAIQRRIQRSQYHMQYSRPVRIVLSTATLLCIIVVLALCAS